MTGGLTAAEWALLRLLVQTCRQSGLPREQWSVVLGTLALALERQSAQAVSP